MLDASERGSYAWYILDDVSGRCLGYERPNGGTTSLVKELPARCTLHARVTEGVFVPAADFLSAIRGPPNDWGELVQVTSRNGERQKVLPPPASDCHSVPEWLSSPSRIRTYNLAVNSRSLYR